MPQQPFDPKPLRIIVGALAAGVAIFLAILFVLKQGGHDFGSGETAPLLSNLAAGLLVANLVVRAVMQRFVPYPQFVIVGAALIEGAGLFGCVAYMLEGTETALFVAVLSIPLILFLQLPTEERWRTWLRKTGQEDEFGNRYDV